MKVLPNERWRYICNVFSAKNEKSSSGAHDNDMISYHDDIVQHISIDMFIC